MRSSLLSSVPGLPVEPTVGLSRPQVARSGSRTLRTPRKQVPCSRTEAAASQAYSEAEAVDESRKRASDVPAERLQDAEGNPPPEAPGEVREALNIAAAPECCNEYEHPLKQIARLAEQDKKQPLDQTPEDHGSWDGRWPLRSRSEWIAHERAGVPWPSGSSEVNAVQTARKEYKWHEMNDSYKESLRIAAGGGWPVWVDNSAVEVLSAKEAKEIRQRLKFRGEGHKILTPRYVFTDKHDGLRTSTNNLRLKASARLVVPGYRDLTAHVLQKDAPTCSRVSFIYYTFGVYKFKAMDFAEC